MINEDHITPPVIKTQFVKPSSKLFKSQLWEDLFKANGITEVKKFTPVKPNITTN